MKQSTLSELKKELKAVFRRSLAFKKDISYLNETIIYCYDKKGNSLGAIFEGEDRFFEWRKGGFETLLLSKEELIYFFQKIIDSNFLKSMILQNEETKIIISTNHNRNDINDLFKMNILEEFMRFDNYVGYQFKRYA